MAVGIGLLLNQATRLPRAPIHSHAAFSAAAAAAAAAAAVSSSGVPLSARHFFGFPGFTVAHCDASATYGLNDTPDLINDLNSKIYDSIHSPIKEYPLELKPLYYAFQFKIFGVTTLRAFLLYYLPLLEPRPPSDDDEDDDLLQDDSERPPVDLVTPFHKSLKQIARETSVVTTRRVLERITVRHVSQRTAWKYLKDAAKSSKRKAIRGMPIPEYTYCVARTTFRTHTLGVAAAWVVQSIVQVYKCFVRKPDSDDDQELFDEMEKFRLFGRKIYSVTIKCGFSLVFASIGAGLGALLHSHHGQWIGCVLGDLAGPVIAILVFEKLGCPLED
ncbi:uncharacterized protein LOC100835754 [Brachypodium distachyon]|uniref:Uncharacterized protein n=1 Tax=Brachypodium distachyon TaxID=15368 RepID=I1II93_BRADI|nr:uncharacterized protein LOC100835754 [Brachypodium distachyon]KQJ86658.1 hypothetical protein BRADI_4g06950v3 [Brachypodium distachyon]|eukprot:XP_003576132.1 uncharacterized protein LOC100835754 [Brachypodium distachyon]